ncbi:MAG: zinc ABC transporter substrate-binding protein, partial [Patescibacteria group bacterium]
MKKKLTVALILSVLAVSVVVAVNIFKQTENENRYGNMDGKIQITASFYPYYFFASEIVGDKAIVYNLTPAGAEPHEYELTARDNARVEDSRLLIVNGNNFEGWGKKIRDSLSGSGVKIIAVGESVATGLAAGDPLANDPHVWL